MRAALYCLLISTCLVLLPENADAQVRASAAQIQDTRTYQNRLIEVVESRFSEEEQAVLLERYKNGEAVPEIIGLYFRHQEQNLRTEQTRGNTVAIDGFVDKSEVGAKIREQVQKLESSTGQFRSEAGRRSPLDRNRARTQVPESNDTFRLDRAAPQGGSTTSATEGLRFSVSSVVPDFERLPLPTAFFTDNLGIAASGGELLVAYPDFAFPSGLGVIRSSDQGMTWSVPEALYPSPINGFVLQFFGSTSGRIFLRYAEIVDPINFEIATRYVYSDDGGSSWSAPASFGFDGDPSSITGLNQTADGTLWYVYQEFDFTTYEVDILYVRSTDDGTNWSSPELFPLNDPNFGFQIPVQRVTSLFGFDLVALFDDSYFDFNSERFVRRTGMYLSSDGGATWLGPLTLCDCFDVNVARDGSNVWASLTVEQPIPGLPPAFANLTDRNLFYAASSDGGSNFDPLVQFTQFIGLDWESQVAGIGGVPYVIFKSDRSPRGTYGGSLFANDPAPPYILTNELGVARSDRPVRAFVLDETGVVDVHVEYVVDPLGTPMELSSMLNKESDGFWSGVIGPVDYAECVQPGGFNATDTDGNMAQVETFAPPYPVPLRHDVGNVWLNSTRAGLMGTGFFNFANCGRGSLAGNLVWPAPADKDFPDSFIDILNRVHLFSGNAWIAASRESESPDVFTLFDFEPVDGSVEVDEEWGVSDQDIRSQFTDGNAPGGSAEAPIGLTITRRSYQWAEESRDDFIIVAYDVAYDGAEDLSELLVGNFFDADIGFLFDIALQNIGAVDPVSGLLYMKSPTPDLLGNPFGYVGLKIMDAPFQSQGLFYNGSLLPAETPLPTDPTSAEDVYDYMVNGALPDSPEPGDLRMIHTANLGAVPSGESRTMYFGIVMGADLDDLRANAATMELIQATGFAAITDGIDALTAYVESLGLSRDVERALTQKLRNAARLYVREQDTAGDNILAAFINQVLENETGELSVDEIESLTFLAGLIQGNESSPNSDWQAGAKDGPALIESDVPGEFDLSPAYPNPFNPITTFRVSVPEAGDVQVDVFNVLGQRVQTILNGSLSAGRHNVRFDGGNLPSGTYLVRMQTKQGVHIQRVVLMK